MNEKRKKMLDLIYANKDIYYFKDHYWFGELIRWKPDKITAEEKSKVEEALNIKLPEPYIWCYENIGHFGVPIEDPLKIMDNTLSMRKYSEKFPKSFIELDSLDFYQVCLDCNTGRVAEWWEDQEEYDIKFQTFEDYVLYLIEDHIEFLEDDELFEDWFKDKSDYEERLEFRKNKKKTES